MRKWRENEEIADFIYGICRECGDNDDNEDSDDNDTERTPCNSDPRDLWS